MTMTPMYPQLSQGNNTKSGDTDNAAEVQQVGVLGELLQVCMTDCRAPECSIGLVCCRFPLVESCGNVVQNSLVVLQNTHTLTFFCAICRELFLNTAPNQPVGDSVASISFIDFAICVVFG